MKMNAMSFSAWTRNGRSMTLRGYQQSRTEHEYTENAVDLEMFCLSLTAVVHAFHRLLCQEMIIKSL